MSFVNDLERIHTALTTDYLPRLHDAVAKVEAGGEEALQVLKDVVNELHAVAHSTQVTPVAEEPVQAQATVLGGGASVADVAGAQPGAGVQFEQGASEPIATPDTTAVVVEGTPVDDTTKRRR